jgi:23S rRNA (cytosine1962-C5)-methyltransferase
MDVLKGNLFLKADRYKPVRQRHPWIFSGAIQRVGGAPAPGDLVAVRTQGGDYLATGYYNPQSQIRARLLTWDERETLGPEFWRARLARALAMRRALALEPATTAYRLVNAEADGLPGLIVDRYGDYLVVQSLTLGIERRKAWLIDALWELLQPAGIVERSEVNVRSKEGLEPATGLLRGVAPPEPLRIQENGLPYYVDVWRGHKTGHYLDQRDNRARVAEPRFVAGRRVLNVFAYSGGFGVYAGVRGAQAVTHVDSSAELLAQAQANMQLNGLDRRQDEYITADAFELLRQFRGSGRRFDMIILDPPKFAHSQADITAATRGYKDLNWLACRLLEPGGWLATFSCSGLVSAELFQKVVFGAALDAGRDAQIIYTLTQGPDHPVLLSFPEAAYLKGLLLRIE